VPQIYLPFLNYGQACDSNTNVLCSKYKGILLHVIVRFPWRSDIGGLPHNNVNTLVAISLMMPAARHHYCVCDNGCGERRFYMVTRLLSTDFCWFVELVRVGRLREKVPS
jgi:hypothetical protein